MNIRPALDQDIPALKDIALNGLSNDTLWQFCFPSRTQGPVAESYLENVFERCIHSNDGGWTIAVAETPNTHQVVSFAIWQNIDKETSEHYNAANQVHRTFDLASGIDQKAAERISLLESAIIRNQQQLLARHGRLMFLHAIVTHPHWKGNGYAKLLCKHSLQLAQTEGVVVATLASPFNGYVFYSGNGFASGGCSDIEVEGQLDQLRLQVMTHAPRPVLEARRSSFMDFLTWGERSEHSPTSDDQKHGSFFSMFGLGGHRSSGDWTSIKS